eukprot:4664963-Alexandrium_andersonii.AAC.1
MSWPGRRAPARAASCGAWPSGRHRRQLQRPAWLSWALGQAALRRRKPRVRPQTARQARAAQMQVNTAAGQSLWGKCGPGSTRKQRRLVGQVNETALRGPAMVWVRL